MSIQTLNHTIHQAVAVVVDNSISMGTAADPRFGPPIGDLNGSIKQFYLDLAAITHCAVDVMVVSFANDVKVERAFEPAQSAVPPTFTTRGSSTNLGGGIAKALDEVLAHREYVRGNGLEVKQPWLVCISDGQPNMNTAPGFDVRLLDLINRDKLVFLPVAVGGYASYEALERLSPKQNPIIVSSSAAGSMSFAEFFRFVSQSMEAGQIRKSQNTVQNNE